MRPGTPLQYWAGVFDSAGCIRMKKSPAGPAPHISVRSATAELPQRIVKAFGGRVLKEKSGTFMWSRTHRPALDMLVALRPFMQRQLSPLVFEWVPGVSGRRRVAGARVVRLMEDR